MSEDERLSKLSQALAMMPDRVQGFSYGPNFTAPHVIRDTYKRPNEQELWRGDDQEEMMRRCKMERLRIALRLSDLRLEDAP